MNAWISYLRMRQGEVRAAFSPLWSDDRRSARRFHAFAPGPPRTGTHSIAGMFAASYRSFHEPLPLGQIDALRKFTKGRYSLTRYQRILTQRDRILQLEMEANWMQGFTLKFLPSLFPQAKFLITWRQPQSWLRSVLNMHYNILTDRGPIRDCWFYAWKNLYFGPRIPADFASWEQPLLDAGLLPIRAYLDTWAWHYENALCLPTSRTLHLPLDQLSNSANTIANFLDIDPCSLDTERSHEGTIASSSPTVNWLDKLPADALEGLLQEICTPVLDRARQYLPPRAT